MHGFVDSEPDPFTGFHSFGRRVYDPQLRRWLTPDPLLWGNPEVDTATGEQLNLYAYSGNNPATYTDRSGLHVESAIDAASIGAGVYSIANWNDQRSKTDKVLDVLGLAADVVCLALPLVPGGFGIGLKVARAGEKIADGVKVADKALGIANAADKAADATKVADKAADAAGKGGNVTKEVIERGKPGRDGATSKHIIEKMDGETTSKTHQVTKDGKIIHQHQDHFGKHGGERRFPDEWTGTETINAPDHIPRVDP